MNRRQPPRIKGPAEQEPATGWGGLNRRRGAFRVCTDYTNGNQSVLPIPWEWGTDAVAGLGGGIPYPSAPAHPANQGGTQVRFATTLFVTIRREVGTGGSGPNHVRRLPEPYSRWQVGEGWVRRQTPQSPRPAVRLSEVQAAFSRSQSGRSPAVFHDGRRHRRSTEASGGSRRPGGERVPPTSTAPWSVGEPVPVVPSWRYASAPVRPDANQWSGIAGRRNPGAANHRFVASVSEHAAIFKLIGPMRGCALFSAVPMAESGMQRTVLARRTNQQR